MAVDSRHLITPGDQLLGEIRDLLATLVDRSSPPAPAGEGRVIVEEPKAPKAPPAGKRRRS